MLRSLFTQSDVQHIERIHILKEPVNDILIWKEFANEEFLVKSAYSVARGVADGAGFGVLAEGNLWSFLWSSNITPKINLFWWRVCYGSLLVNVVLRERIIHVSSSCCVCESEHEFIYYFC